MPFQAEYIWIDGVKPTPTLRSKTKVMADLGSPEVIGDAKICKVSIVGIGMRSHVGVASRMFESLSAEGINIQMISTSEIKTSVVLMRNTWSLLCARCIRRLSWSRRRRKFASTIIFAGNVTEWPKVLPC